MLAELQGVSLRELQKVFQKSGHTIGSVICEYRLQQTVQKLSLTHNTIQRHSITNLALECGFADLSYFNRRFKRRFGCCPTKYKINQSQ